MKDRFNDLYDPRQANSVCVTGQLLLLDLIEQVERSECAKLLQANTDGILVELTGEPNASYSVLDDVAYEWEQRTGMRLEFEEYAELFQKDVNNYVLIAEDGHFKSKGAYVKKLSLLDQDLPIVNRALVAYLTEGTPIEETILGCTELMPFQKIYKVSSKYVCALHNGEHLKEKVFRVFASNDYKDGALYKMKNKGGALVAERFAGCPEHCFIDNGWVRGKDAPKRLNKAWYVELAKQRLLGFLGNNGKDSYELF